MKFMTEQETLKQPVSEIELATAMEVADNEQVRWILRRLAFERDQKKPSGLTIAQLISDSHATAVEKGWWEQDRPFSEGIALMHSELSEALEEWRKFGMSLEHMIYFAHSNGKPEGIAVEFADVLIRIGDWCGKHNIPLEEALRAKMEYNKTRTFRHGNKLA